MTKNLLQKLRYLFIILNGFSVKQMTQIFLEGEMVKIWPKSLIFWLILWAFLFMPSYTWWIAPQNFAKWKTLLRYTFVVGSISIAYVVVKLKFSKFLVLSQHPWNGPLLGFLALIPPIIVSSWMKFWREIVQYGKDIF